MKRRDAKSAEDMQRQQLQFGILQASLFLCELRASAFLTPYASIDANLESFQKLFYKFVELKAKSAIHPVDKAQTLSHLRLMNLQVGLLINFHEVRLVDGVNRIVNNFNED